MMKRTLLLLSLLIGMSLSLRAGELASGFTVSSVNGGSTTTDLTDVTTVNLTLNMENVSGFGWFSFQVTSGKHLIASNGVNSYEATSVERTAYNSGAIKATFSSDITWAPGEYSLTLEEGLISNGSDYNAACTVNNAFSIAGGSTTPEPSVDVDAIFANRTISPAEGIVTQVGGNYYLRFPDRGDFMITTNQNYVDWTKNGQHYATSELTLEEDGAVLVINNVPETTEAGEYVVTFPVGSLNVEDFLTEDPDLYIRGTNSEAISFTYTIEAPQIKNFTLSNFKITNSEGYAATMPVEAPLSSFYFTAKYASGMAAFVNGINCNLDESKRVIVKGADGTEYTAKVDFGTALKATLDEPVTAAGNYSVIIPAGMFTVKSDNSVNEELTVANAIEIKAAKPEVNLAEIFSNGTISPAAGTVTKIGGEYSVSFPNRGAAYIFSNVETVEWKKNGQHYATSTLNMEGDMSALLIENVPETTEAGEYTVTFPAGSLRAEDFDYEDPLGNNPEAISFTYTIEAPQIKNFTLSNFKITNSEGYAATMPVEAPLSSFYFTAKYASGMAAFVNGINCNLDESKRVIVKGADGTEYTAKVDFGTALKATLDEPVTAAGNYSVIIPAGMFTVKSDNSVNEELTVANAIEIKAAEPEVNIAEVLAGATISPAAGTVEKLGGNYTINFPNIGENTVGVHADKVALTKDGNPVNVTLTAANDEDTFQAIIVTLGEVTEAGTYNLVLNPGAVTVSSADFMTTYGDNETAITFTYTIEAAPVVEPFAITDFTICNSNGQAIEMPTDAPFSSFCFMGKVNGTSTYVNMLSCTIDDTKSMIIKDINGNEYTASATMGYGGNVVTLSTPLTAPGKYSLTIPEGFFIRKSGNKEPNAELTIENAIEIKGAVEPQPTVNVAEVLAGATISPAAGIVEKLGGNYTINFPNIGENTVG
ncbi:MAG: hypothetical protein NC356_03060, partial [Ruminococcus sp.]|nr:hypothetical protein [Ruminococcus sp.]